MPIKFMEHNQIQHGVIKSGDFFFGINSHEFFTQKSSFLLKDGFLRFIMTCSDFDLHLV